MSKIIIVFAECSLQLGVAKFVMVDYMQVKRLSLKSGTFISGENQKSPFLRKYLVFFVFSIMSFELEITPRP